MACFTFFSTDSYDVVMNYLHELELGDLVEVFEYTAEEGTHYLVVYRTITCPSFAEVMREASGEKKLIYGVNEHGYPLYWKIWW
jgi:hypothetical protein